MEYIAKIVKQWKDESQCEGVIQFNYTYSTGILIIYSPYPGFLVGKAGCHIDKYNLIFKDVIHGFNKIEFIQTNYYFVM